jgi:riboflavin kinase/FMN adenylyltransferase
MQIFRHFPLKNSQTCALAIGNFDGLHLGHQALLKALKKIAVEQALSTAVITFEPHPREFFTPEKAPARLTSLREKLERFADAGVDVVYLCRFDQRFASLSSEAFISDVLIKSLNAKSILVGEDFRFGAGRRGGVVDIANAGLNLISLPQVNLIDDDIKALGDSERVSSTRVRNALASGQLVVAKNLLARPYSISGKVIHGAQLGRKLGFPTANVHMRHERPALTGVYAVKLDGFDGVANLGVRPTIAGVPKLLLEVHLFDFEGDLYDKHVHVEFYHKIRDEMKFDGLDALKVQIAKDAKVARDFFKQNLDN